MTKPKTIDCPTCNAEGTIPNAGTFREGWYIEPNYPLDLRYSGHSSTVTNPSIGCFQAVFRGEHTVRRRLYSTPIEAQEAVERFCESGDISGGAEQCKHCGTALGDEQCLDTDCRRRRGL